MSQVQKLAMTAGGVAAAMYATSIFQADTTSDNSTTRMKRAMTETGVAVGTVLTE